MFPLCVRYPGKRQIQPNFSEVNLQSARRGCVGP